MAILTAEKVSAFGVFSGPNAYSVRMRENADQKNSEYGHFSRSAYLLLCW